MEPDHAQPADDAVRRRRVAPTLAVVVTTLLLIGAVAGLATYPVRHDSPDLALASATATGGTADDADRDAAIAVAQALLDATPLPAGAVPQNASPTPVLDYQAQGGPVDHDSSLDRTAWWTVPMSASDFAAYVAAHAPPGLVKSGGGTGTMTDTHAGTTVSWTDDDFTGKGTDAYTPPQLWMRWTALDGGTAVGAVVYIGARWARSPQSYVTGRIRRVDVRITGTRPPVSRSYTRRATVTRLRAIFDGLPGDLHNEGKPLVTSCNAMLLSTTTVTFHLPQDTVRVRDVATGCGDSLVGTRNRRRMRPPLDPDGFHAGVAAIVRMH